jgi:type I restriction enzyme S subunit
MPEKSQYPQVALSELVHPNRPITYGIVQPGPDVSPGGVPLIRGKDYSSGKVDSSALYHVKPEIDAPYRRSKVLAGDILLSIVGYVGQAAVVPEELAGANITQTTARVSIDPAKANNFYVYQHLASPHFRPQICRFEKGSAQPGLNLSDVERLRIALPRHEVQQRVADVLFAVDDAIAQTEALIAKTQQIKAGLMHDLFTRGVTPDGQLRPPREEAPKLCKESPIGWIPSEWEVGRLPDKRSSGRPYLKTGPFGSSLKLEHWVDVGRPVVTIGALGEGEFLLGELLHVSEETAERLREYQLEAGDVVFSRVADVGRSATIGEEHRGWVMSSNLMRISLDRGAIVPDFLQAQLAYDARVRRQIRATVNAGGRDVANSATLNRLHFPWPCKQEQERVVDRFACLVRSRQANIALLNKLRLVKAGLMHDLLTGRVRVPINEPKGVAI